MFKFIRKETNDIVAPVNGKCIEIEKVPDKVFSSKMMGDGFAIIPSDEIIAAPIDGKIVMLANSKHAFGMKNGKGLEVLVHVGLDTVKLNGKGFELLGKVGDNVKKNTPILKFNKDIMKENNIDMTTMVIFTSGYEKEVLLDCYDQMINRGDILIK